MLRISPTAPHFVLFDGQPVSGPFADWFDAKREYARLNAGPFYMEVAQ